MKKIRIDGKYLVVITLAIVMLVMMALSFFSCEKKVEKIELSFKVGGETYATIKTTGSEMIQIPENPSKAGYIFDGWYWDKDVWSKPFTANSLLDEPISGDMSVYAKLLPITYSISYETDGGVHNNPATYTVESGFVLADAQKAGYTFLGWYIDAAFTKPIKAISASTIGNIVLHARFELTAYSIIYTNTKGAENRNPDTYTIDSELITFMPLSKEGYIFDGWYVGDTKVMEISKGSVGDLALTAKWDAIGYTITYHNVVGATHNNASFYDAEDLPFALLDASKDYYVFRGWCVDEALTNVVTEIAIGTIGNLELWAKWEAVEYAAIFKDGDTVVDTVKFTVETESIIPPSVPEHTGCTGAWESYTLGHEDITISAVYTPITYTITYTETKGVENSNVGTYTIESENIILADLSAVGYVFDGWYDGDKKVTQIPTGSIGNLTLTAKWTAIKYSITYLYDHEIGDYADENKNPTTYTIEDEFDFISLVNHTPGYTFDGWFTEKNNGTGDKVTGVALGTTGDITVYAQWGLGNYTITYHNVNGATNTNAENYNVETETFNIEDISRIGYVFDGWYADAEFTTPASTTIVKGSTGNIDMYAKWTPIGYSITYILFGETVDDITNPDRYTIEDSFVLNNPTREGYVFVGWYTLNENGERVTEIKANTAGNQTLYARWIKFESNGGSTVSYTPIYSGNAISAPTAPTREHYGFEGWYTNEELTQKYNFEPTKSITLYAKWIPVEYEIEYILNGGTNPKNNPETYTVEDKFELCAPDKVGYTFVGWFADPEFTSTVVTEIKAGTSGKITLYAHYLINQYTISFESNGGATVSAITQNYATDVTAPEAPAKNGYEFAGWYTDAALKKVHTFTTMPAEDITLYAKWNIVTYDITYNLDGGTNHRNNPSTYKITSADITLGTPTKTGYTFGGWYTDSACTQSITKIANGSFGDVELFAKWTATVYTVTYNMPSGATQSNAATYTIETNLIILTSAALKGYTFNGWYSDESYTTPVTAIAGGAIGDVVLYAKFTESTYNVWLEGDEEAKHTVSFDLNGAEGTVVDQTVTPTATLKYPTIPTRSEHIFAGWYDNAACTGAPYDFTAVVTKDTTLYAKWAKIENASLITINGSADVTLNGKREHLLVFVPLVSGNITITSSGEYDTFATLYNSEMVALVQNDDGAADGSNFHIVYNVTAGETYYIGARAFSSTTTGSATVSIAGDTTVLDGGYAITTRQTPITYGTSFTLTLPDVRDGYKFLGYADKDGVMYTDANGSSIKMWDKAEDTVLYSVWERAIYTVTFVTSGGTPIDSVTLAYGDRFDISKYVTTREGYTFNGWYLDGEEYNATIMPDHSITLTAYWKIFALGTIKYDTDKKEISVNDTITPELFDALCLDTNGNLASFTVSISGTQAAGETITVRLTATGGGKTKVVTIKGIKVYGAPTLSFDDSVDYVNVNGGMTASHFGASGKDTFGAATKIKVYIDGEYKAGTSVKIVIESIDVVGNITYGYIENVKAYGLPEIAYNKDKTAISINDTLNAELFGATAKDSFGKSLAVTISKVSGTISAGKNVTLCISATDSKGNVTNIYVVCKVYGTPTVSNAVKTDVRADDTVTPELLGITGTDTYGKGLTVTLTTKSGTQTAGTVWTVTATVTDAAGNVTKKNYKLNIYGTPTVSYERECMRADEDAAKNPAEVLNAAAKDSFGKALDVTVTVKAGGLVGGTNIVYTLAATDHLGNTYSIDTAPIGVYDVNDIKLTYSAGMSDLIKLTSKGEEFDAKATDSFGNSCDITIEAAKGYSLEGGKVITLYVVATDREGNRVLSQAIEGIRVYGIPTVTFVDHVYENSDVDFIGTVRDSFGEELYAQFIPEGELAAGNLLKITVKAEDDAGNVLDKTYELVVEREGHTYTRQSDGTYAFASYAGSDGIVNILATYAGKPVTAIAAEALKNKNAVTTVVIPDSVTSIGEKAFYNCRSLTSITVDANNPNYRSIDGNLYSKDGKTLIQYAIGKSATTFTIPDSVTSIGDYAFYDCGSLTSVTIGDSVKSIGDSAFYNCYSLTNITIGDSVTSIGDYAFYNCRSLTSVTISDSVTSIGDYAFKSCSLLTSITIPDSVTSIGSSAFYGCSSLTSITLPFVGGSAKTASDTYQYPLGYIFGTSSYTGGVATYQSYYGSSASSTTSAKYYIPSSLKSVTVTGGNILYGAFYNCSNLTNITIGNGVTGIVESAFWGCSSLTSVTIGDSVTSIVEYAFSGCTSLKSVTIGDGVMSIGAGAFSGCKNLMSITLPFVGGSAKIASGTCRYPFGYIFGTSSYTGGVATEQYNGSTSTTYYIPSSLKSVTVTGGNIFYGAFYNCSKLTNVTIGDGVTGIGERAFYNCSSLTSITIPDSVTSIGDDAFSRCSSLTSVTIPDSVTHIGDYAFSDCSSLTSITIGDSVTSIGDAAFAYCYSLTSITVGGNNLNYSSIDGNLYSKDGKILIQYAIGKTVTTFTIPDSVTRIGGSAFYSCSSLTSITIGDSVTSIVEYAFWNCGKLVEVYNLSSLSIEKGSSDYGYVGYYALNVYTSKDKASKLWTDTDGYIFYEDGNTCYLIGYTGNKTKLTLPNSCNGKNYAINQYAFYYCSSLTSITIPDSVTSIGDSAFQGCSSLTSITIPDGVTSIGDSAFYSCSSLTSITIGDSVTNINDFAFAHCDSLTRVTIPDSVVRIQFTAFYGCSSLTSVTFQDTSTWYYVSGSRIESVSVTNAADNAMRLRSSSYAGHWYKR